MTDTHVEFVIASYAFGAILIALEIVFVRRRLARARQDAARTTDEDDEVWKSQ